ncbi:MAG TPA: HTH domain-containing protein [Sphingobacteriaceae bacterium]
MDYFTYEERLNYLLELAQKGRFLSQRQMAQKFECSEATIKRMVKHLKGRGHDLRYSRALNKFYIEE